MQSKPASYVSCNVVLLAVLALAGLSYICKVHHVMTHLTILMETTFHCQPYS